ncbi:MAG: aminotransferase class I/II-fold pyridoxal phosphate-dependent enzyme [Patescibacteria group bacterium]
MEVFSFSKCLNMSGFRVGFVAGNNKMVQALASTDSYLLYGVPSFIQIAAAYGLDHLDDFDPSICNTYARRAMVMQSEFSAVGWPMTAPKSTMFMWTRIPEPFAAMDSFGFAKKLLDEADIAVSPGKGFGEEGEGFVRFALNQSAERIQEAAVRVGKFLKKG